MKLSINKPGDEYEQEADNVADEVMRTPDSQLQRACACGGGCPSCQAKHFGREPEGVQAKDAGVVTPGESVAPPIVHEVLDSPGQALDSATRSFMEPRFGGDFSHVRVHTDEKAAQSAQAVGAFAYTAGNDIVFAPGQWSPGSQGGKRLLAHELTHVIQQAKGGHQAVQREAAKPTGGNSRIYDNVTPEIFECLKAKSIKEHRTDYKYDKGNANKGTATTKKTLLYTIVFEFELNPASKQLKYTLTKNDGVASDNQVWGGLEKDLNACRK